MVTEAEINHAAEDLQNMRSDLFIAANAVAACEYIRDESEALAVVRGQIVGKNAEELDARKAVVLSSEEKNLFDAKEKHRVALCCYELAKIEWDRIDMLMRLSEIGG